MATASQHASSLQQQQQQQAKTCKLKLVVWRRPLTFPDTAEVVDAAMERYYAALFDSANYNGLHCIHILIRECRLILGDMDVKPYRVIIDSMLSLRTCCDVLAKRQHSKRGIASMYTTLYAHSRHEKRFIVDESDGRSDVVKCIYGNPISASVLVSFVNSRRGTVYEIAISENSVVVMTKPALTIIKITEGDSADPVWFNLEVNLPCELRHTKVALGSSTAVVYDELMSDVMMYGSDVSECMSNMKLD